MSMMPQFTEKALWHSAKWHSAWWLSVQWHSTERHSEGNTVMLYSLFWWVPQFIYYL